MFSRRTDHDRAPNAVTRALAAARDAGSIRADLTVSNPTALGLGFGDVAIHAALADTSLERYEPDPSGSRATRDAFGEVLGLPAGDVIVTASTSEAYAYLFAVLADPGDRVLVPRPSYPLLEWLAKLSGVELVPYDLRYDGERYLDDVSLHLPLALDRPARAIVAIHPNNPTGSYLKRDELTRLAACGIPLVLDEVFAHYPIESAPPSPFVADAGVAFRLTGLSKLCALPQMKIGCIGVTGDRALVDEAKARLELVADTFLSVASPSDHAASRLIVQSGGVRERIGARCRENLATLDRLLAQTSASRLRVEAGWCVIVRMPAIATEDEWTLALLARGVAVQPGWFYDLGSGVHVVVSLLPDPTEFEFGIGQLVRSLSRPDSSR